MNAAKLTLGPGIPGGPGTPCGPGGPCVQKISPVMISFHCPPSLTSSGQLLASYFLPSQTGSYSMQLGLSFKSTEGPVRGYWPLEEILVLMAGGPSVLRDALLNMTFFITLSCLRFCCDSPCPSKEISF